VLGLGLADDHAHIDHASLSLRVTDDAVIAHLTLDLSSAQTTRRDVLVPLLRDPHADVIAILLDNPKLTERDAVIIAAARPQAPAVLGVVADHARWSSRHAVKRALVLNPSTPVHVAVRIATTLKRADLVEIARDIHLADALRAHAAELLVTPKRI